MEIQAGQVFTLGGSLSISGMAQTGSGFAEFIGNYSNSLHWGGINFVENALTGEIINDWTITSESGTNYALPVELPEPSGLALLAMAGLPRLMRRRKERELSRSGELAEDRRARMDARRSRGAAVVGKVNPNA